MNARPVLTDTAKRGGRTAQTRIRRSAASVGLHRPGLGGGIRGARSGLAGGLGELLLALLLQLLLLFLFPGQLTLAFLERVVGLGQKTLLDGPAGTAGDPGSLRGFDWAVCLMRQPGCTTVSRLRPSVAGSTRTTGVQ